MSDPELCGVCSEKKSKYKCPHCELKYCSIVCFKSHIATHEAAAPASSLSPNHATSSEIDLRPAASASPSATTHDGTAEVAIRPAAVESQDGDSLSPLDRLRNDPRFIELFTKYPTLKAQLRAVYKSTLEPERQEDQTKQEDDDMENGGNQPSRQRRQRRPNQHWAQDKADNRAVAQLIEMQLWNEGMAEFLDLVRMAHGNSARKQELLRGC